MHCSFTCQFFILKNSKLIVLFRLQYKKLITNELIFRMRRIYTIFLYFLVPFIILRLFIKSMRFSEYRKRIKERFGFVAVKPADIWIHAVSLGEVNAVIPLVKELLSRNFKVIITTMTPTGSKQILSTFGDKVQHCYVPYDFPIILQRFLNKIKVKAVLILETEIWPNMIAIAKEQNCKLFLINGRISDKSISSYKKFRFFFKNCLNQFDRIFAQSSIDKQRFIEIGADESRVEILGNIKFDNIIKKNNDDLLHLKQKWGAERPVLILASTHNNEEELFFDNLKNLQKAINGLLLVIAPRHPERFNRVHSLSVQNGFKTALRSEEATINPDCDVLVVNTLGELNKFYGLADYAFVGGSFVPIGGHNVLEPIAWNIPVFTGPHMQNSREIVAQLLEEGAMIVAKDIQDLSDNLINLYNNQQKLLEITKKAEKLLKNNQGSIKKYLNHIEEVVQPAV